MKFPIVNLVLTVFILWLTIQIESNFENYLAYFFILTVGIVHGANDISLINYIKRDESKSQLKYIALYISVIALMSLAFFQFPFIALCVFVAFSCYHFGEQHFYSKLEKSGLYASLLFVSYGALIFGLLFYLNLDATTMIISELTSVTIPKSYFLNFLLVSSFATIASIVVNYKNFKQDVPFFHEVFIVVLFIILFKLASLLWAFAIYFIIWHSIPSLKDQTKILYGKIDTSSFIKYLRASFLNWLTSIVGLGLIYYVSTFLDIRFITLFFAFLAAITIPHVVVMHYLNKN